MPGGEIVALSLATGKQLWASKPIPSTEYATNAIGVGWLGTPILVGWNLYAYMGYISSYMIDPIPRFACIECVNATTGETQWILNGGVFPAAASGGYVVGPGILDGNYYCIGKGQTSTSVSAPTLAVPENTKVLIQGNVLDQSPAQPGTPAVSDASMNEYMDYLHMQNATLLNSPPTPTGVQVTLTAVDPNMNTITIGTTTTNGYGNFFYDWSPPASITGTYVVTATFAGSGSYWPSSSQTGVIVTEAAATTSTPTTISSGVSETTLYTAVAAIIIAIIIVGLVLFLLLRKRP